MKSTIEKLTDKFVKKGLSETTIKSYIGNLKKLNKDKPVKSLAFLKNKDEIMDLLHKYKDNTKRNFLITICAVLNGEKLYKKSYDDYYDMLMDKNKTLKSEEAKNEKNDKQKENWIEWEDVVSKYDELYDKAMSIKTIKTSNDYNSFIDAIILGLYTDIPPRRNEYQNLVIGGDKGNRILLDEKKMILDNFKTAKKEGSKSIDLPDKLVSLISSFVKKRGIEKGTPLFLDENGKPPSHSNYITRRLNGIFKKNVGSSMLRHIYLSSKYGKVQDSMKDDADLMSHSTTQQKDYIKNN
jgi:integrase